LPLYEYECANDGVFELVRKFSDPPLTACPKCGGPIEKLASAPAIQFKGTGWYVTDYARKSGGGESGKDRDKPGASKDKAGTDKSAGPGAAKESTGSPSTASPSSGTGSDKK
jgi:putative FmdB family regulatory protein